MKTGQYLVAFTCDLQLYRIVVNVKWSYPERFANVILRLDRMHTLMSFVNVIGTLMHGNGLTEILSDVFVGVPKMKLGKKKWPENVRALRLLAEELVLKTLSECQEITNKNRLMDLLEDLGSNSKTCGWTC